MGTRDREPRASALGWYETGPWPESEGAFSYAQIGKRGGRYIRIYIVPIYSRCSDALLSRLLKNSVLHPPRAPFHTSLAPEENTKRIRREYEGTSRATGLHLACT